MQRQTCLSFWAVSFMVALLAGGCGSAQLAIPSDDEGGIGGGLPPLDSGYLPILLDDAGAGHDASAGEAAVSGLCGDGILEPGEACDDGNTLPGDGCSGICTLEPGFDCPTAGQACVPGATSAVCGNGSIEGSESCDDGNSQSGDGCSSTCQVEVGYACDTPGKACAPVKTPRCGDAQVNAGEQCDDGNNLDGDGCSASCKLEAGWACPQPGQGCTKVEVCGDGVVQVSRSEECDDGNTVPGDGCSGICQLEPGYTCPKAGAPCVDLWVCGNSKVDPGEACDDGNTTSGDGCSADCSSVEPGWTCPRSADDTGGTCQLSPLHVCGNAVVDLGESCDDGNTISGDGCAATCALEPGWTCPVAGQACTRIAFCGDGVLNLDLGEQCDDGNHTSGDGCSAQCQLEPNFACAAAGQSCTSTVICGDGKINGSEQCDDGNTASGDGCSAVCQLEPGYICPTPLARCVAKTCGDGIIAGSEQCDDGNGTSNDGCSSTCQLEPGFACVTVNGHSACHATVCGDGVREGFEQCDDGNLIPYDGCSPSCAVEPSCAKGQCQAVCGDGLKFPQEACDDGNNIAGDGCSPTCTIEPGFDCTTTTLNPPSQLAIPILYRDFLYSGTSITANGAVIATGHPDFQIDPYDGATGLLNATLDTDGKPTFKDSKGSGGATLLQSPASFYWWYHEKSCGDGGCTQNPYERLVYLTAAQKPTTLTLTNISTGNATAVYQFSSGSFFPVDDLGWNAAASTRQVSQADDGQLHNFSFTSELRYQFTYVGNEKLDFTGDDDVWVYINGQLAVDIGGIHGATDGSVTLDAAAATKLGLAVGSMYEIALFQAERHTTASNYRLSLSGFVHAVSQCTPLCGDGKVVGDEVCDDGKNDGSYGSCLPGCRGRGPYCGDAVVQTPPEACDDGVNLTTYGGTAKVCAPGCKVAPYCGDGVVSNGESCDEGALNGTGYGQCSPACERGARCGDGIVNGPEQCDDAINNGSSGDRCAADCTLRCGNGILDPGEGCDDGAANNTGLYGKCRPNCTLGPRCGDGIKNGTEQCDDGKNDGSYGTCRSDCTFANYCGDGKLTDPPELCDLGNQNSASAYGKNLCTTACQAAPYCGDRAVDGAFGETCDDGVNSGQPGSCTSDCQGFVPFRSCGDGVVEAPEVCDDGAANGSLASLCDARCRLKCGNGIKDAGEQCDNGVNDGSYGTCQANCTFAGYCGDGTKNGPEQCDNGASNIPLSSAYGMSLCTSVCTWAAFCGDGRVQAQFGEQCDGTPDCNPNCKLATVQ